MTTEMSDRVLDLERKIERHDEAIENLEKWQAKQNHSLEKIDARLHSLERWIMATLAAALTSIVVNLVMSSIVRR